MNFWLCQHNYMGILDGTYWIETTIPGTELDTLYAQGGMVNDGGEWVWLTNHPQRICESRARLFESIYPESWNFWNWTNRCLCDICQNMI